MESKNTLSERLLLGFVVALGGSIVIIAFVLAIAPDTLTGQRYRSMPSNNEITIEDIRVNSVQTTFDDEKASGTTNIIVPNTPMPRLVNDPLPSTLTNRNAVTVPATDLMDLIVPNGHTHPWMPSVHGDPIIIPLEVAPVATPSTNSNNQGR